MAVFRRAMIVSTLGAVMSYVLGFYENQTGLRTTFGGESSLFGGVIGVIGFLLVFRMAHSYARFQTGSDLVFAMSADFYDATSILVALARSSALAQSNRDDFLKFNQTLVRLVSLLCTLCYAGLAGDEVGNDSENDFAEFIRSIVPTSIDPLGLDDLSLKRLARSKCRPELTYQMLQNLMVDHMDDVLKVPAPLLTRVFQELGTGMIKYHEAFKLVHVPYPFPLIALSEMALGLHWIACPFVFSIWCPSPAGAAFFTFIVEFIMWSMVALASEFDNPFGNDVNDIDLLKLQQHLNHSLASLVENSVASTCEISETRAEHVTTKNYKMENWDDGELKVSQTPQELRDELNSSGVDFMKVKDIYEQRNTPVLARSDSRFAPESKSIYIGEGEVATRDVATRDSQRRSTSLDMAQHTSLDNIDMAETPTLCGHLGTRDMSQEKTQDRDNITRGALPGIQEQRPSQREKISMILRSREQVSTTYRTSTTAYEAAEKSGLDAEKGRSIGHAMFAEHDSTTGRTTLAIGYDPLLDIDRGRRDPVFL